MSSHGSVPVSASLLTVLCVALVHREQPDGLAVGVSQAARAAALSGSDRELPRAGDHGQRGDERGDLFIAEG
jgi:hypothetical protein